MECGASLRRQSPVLHCNSLRCVVCSPWEVVPESGRWQWQAAQAPRRGGVDSDLCLHTAFLVAAAAALASHAHLCGSL